MGRFFNLVSKNNTDKKEPDSFYINNVKNQLVNIRNNEYLLDNNDLKKHHQKLEDSVNGLIGKKFSSNRLIHNMQYLQKYISPKIADILNRIE